MGSMVYSLLWVMQDLYHQPQCRSPVRILGGGLEAEVLGLRVEGFDLGLL